MPFKAPTPCTYPNCPTLTTTARCPAHPPYRYRREIKRKDTRPSRQARGYGRQHEKWRKLILHRDPLCVMCVKNPFRFPKRKATVADHIIPLKQGGTFALSNGQGLCHSCHARKTRHDGSYRT